MEEIGKILPAVFKRRMGRGDAQLAELLAPLWPRVVGRAIAQQSRPVRFAGGMLTLATGCLTWTAQLRQMQEEIRAAINGFLGGSVVKRLRVEHVLKPEAAPPLPQLSSRPKFQGPRVEPPEGLGGLDSQTSGILEQSFAKYFARRGRPVH